jgi:hypothetical protein
MHRDKTIELFLQGREAWNAWAERMLGERKAMEADGRWAADRDVLGSLEPKNDETRAWMEAAAADFSRCLFLVRGAERTKEAAGETKDEDASAGSSVRSISLDKELIDFEGFVFPGYADFESATFTGDADFGSATFTGGAYFGSATFSGRADFGSATFSGGAGFGSATFKGDADFESGRFTREASFGSATFDRDVFFRNRLFEGVASFPLATFKQYATFERAHFLAGASFAAIRGDRGFNMAVAVFEVVPDFIQAHFEEAPRLDNLKVAGRAIAPHRQPERQEAKWRAQKLWRGMRYAGGWART